MDWSCKMKSGAPIFSLILILASALTMGCQGGGSEDLEVKTRGSEFILIDGTGKSCKQLAVDPTAADDVPAIKMVIGQVYMNWKGKSPLQLEYMRIRLQGNGLSGGVFSKTFAGEELSYMFTGAAGTVTFPANAGEIASDSGCAVMVGGLSMTDKTKDAYGQGSALIYATTLDGDTLVPVQTETYFSWRFDGIR